MKDINNKVGYLNDNFKIFHIRDKKDIKFEYHHHDFSKIVILIDGDLTYYIEGKAYILKPWDILFVNKNEIHKPVVNPNKYYERIVIWLNPDFMAKYAQGNNNLLKCFEVAIKNNYNLLRLNMKSIDIIKNHKVNKTGVFHCCQQNQELVKQALQLGYYISFAGPITFKNSKNAPAIIDMVPLDKMLIETDSPYLSPEPHRGQRNDCRNVKYVAQKIADLKGISLEEIAKQTYENAMKIFEIEK